MSTGLEQRKLKAIESYRLNALLTLLVQIFPTHPIHHHLKEKILKSTNSLEDGLIEDKILYELKNQLLHKLPKIQKIKLENIWNHFQASHSFELHQLISQLDKIQKKPKPNYKDLIEKYSKQTLLNESDKTPKLCK